MGYLKMPELPLGVNFTVMTDHKPLLGVINGKNLDAAIAKNFVQALGIPIHG